MFNITIINANQKFYLDGDPFAECDISGHSEVIQLQHVRDTGKSMQELPHLNKEKFIFTSVWYSLWKLSAYWKTYPLTSMTFALSTWYSNQLT